METTLRKRSEWYPNGSTSAVVILPQTFLFHHVAAPTRGLEPSGDAVVPGKATCSYPRIAISNDVTRMESRLSPVNRGLSLSLARE
jgi:hypothetical protein